MKKLFKHLLALSTLLLSSAALAGGNVTPVNPPQPTQSGNKIEVLEFFAYPCPHCFHLHPDLSAWEKKLPKDVTLTYVPVVFRDSWEPMAYTFYALEALGQLPRLHGELFDAWNVNHIELYDLDHITSFVAQRGVDRKKFSDAYNSFTVQTKVVRSKQMLQNYRISGTPTIIVDGRFAISGLQPADTIRTLNELLDQVRKERAGGKR
ncbi:MAG: thiol:disulfide interchange protein DsbA/DsbL [Nitrosomonadales bacterium]|nr:thiol:disulfide interchange protein DsbA/DsbL [Nitrosomonadales bacterium]